VTRRALFFGRFQPFHLGHLNVVRWVLEERGYDEIVILVGMASESHTPRNPFTAGERILMIREALREAGIGLDRLITATLPTMETHVGCAHYVLTHVPPVEAIVTRNPVIARIFREAGIRVEKPPAFNRDEYRGEHIRALIARGARWEHLVPPAVARIIREIGGEERIREIMSSD